MTVAPVCECPKCSMLGLHLMPYIATTTESKPGVRMWVEDVPATVWYDGRDAEPGLKPMVRTHYQYDIVEIEITMLFRECVFCRHEWSQELGRRQLD